MPILRAPSCISNRWHLPNTTASPIANCRWLLAVSMAFVVMLDEGLALWATPSAQGGAIPAGKINIGYPDISSLHPDLESPEISEDEPAAGRRVRTTLPKWRGTSVYFSLYLPIDWKHGHTFPVIVEYPGNGNYRSKHGDICTGRVEDCNLGFGISGGKGSIWICLPFVDETKHENALQWWGNVDVTVAFCKEAVAYICSKYGGDPTAVFLCGFSRGAIACNFIGLHDEEIAGIWRGFFAASHYDGARAWPYAGSDRAAARERLERLGNRRVFVSHEVYDVTPETYTIVDTINYLAGTGRSLSNFRFQLVPIRNHTDRWVLYDIPARHNLRIWFHEAIAAKP